MIEIYGSGPHIGAYDSQILLIGVEWALRHAGSAEAHQAAALCAKIASCNSPGTS
jgi:hypothetical protein